MECLVKMQTSLFNVEVGYARGVGESLREPMLSLRLRYVQKVGRGLWKWEWNEKERHAHEIRKGRNKGWKGVKMGSRMSKATLPEKLAERVHRVRRCNRNSDGELRCEWRRQETKREKERVRARRRGGKESERRIVNVSRRVFCWFFKRKNGTVSGSTTVSENTIPYYSCTRWLGNIDVLGFGNVIVSYLPSLSPSYLSSLIPEISLSYFHLIYVLFNCEYLVQMDLRIV